MTHSRRRTWCRLWLVPLGAALFACADLGHYVWLNDLPDAPASSTGEYRLAPGDVVLLRVFNQEGVSGRLRIRSDGRITVPFVNDVQAAGTTTRDLAKTLETRLREFINQPVVTVSLEEAGSSEISVL